MLNNDGELAVAAAEAGAAVVLERYGTELARFDKAPGDFATEADVEAEKVILEVLRQARPGDVVVGEEGGRSEGAAGGSASHREWLVDLDPPFPNAPAFRAARLLLDERFTGRFRPRVISSTLAVAWVAAGRRAAYVTDGHLSESVHFAAGIALCQAAGCVVTALDGSPVHSGMQGLIAAAEPGTHAALLDLARAQQ